MDASAKSNLERTVVLKQDRDGGYGFSLSKDGPVVTQVTAGSSAERAGVNAGNRLVKVNGQDVGSMKVPEVEEMVQQCSHITLTLQGKLAQNGTRAVKDSGVEISAPRQMQELTLQTMRNMLQKQRKAYETLSVNYCKAPSEKLEREIQDCESIIKLLESEIASKSPPIDAHIRTTAASVQALSSRHPVTKMADDMDLLASRKALTTSTTHSKAFVKGGSVKHPSRAATFHNGSISPSKRRHHMLGFLGGGSSGHIVDSSDQSDDDDLSDAVDGASEAGPFGSLQELRNNPAHMSVFIHYLNTNKNPNTLLFYLVSLSYQNHCKIADLRQRGMDIFWTFFTDQAPLPVDVDSTIMSRTLHTLEVEENENHLRSAFVESRECLSEVIIADLADYRHKRVMGLAGMFGDHMLTNNMSISRQTEVVMNLLIPQIKAKNDDTHCANIMEASKSHAVAACLATFVLDSIGKSGIAKATSSAPLDKTQTFTRGDILLRKGRGGKKKSTIQKHGHNLHLETYTRPAFCDLCNKQLWGIIYQGYQCSECKMNIHRYYCLGQLEQPCLGKNPGFMSTSRKRRTSQHSIKKIHLSAILTGQPPPPVEDTDIDLARVDSEGGRKSPLLEPASLDSREGELLREMDGGDDHHLPTTKPRSTSDPKHMLLIQSASVMPGEQPEHHHPKRESLKVSRTQSAKYDTREDHMASKQISDPHNVTMSSSDDSLIGAKLESIVEGGGAVCDDEIKELLDHDIEEELLPWALSVKREVVQSLQPYEVQRQEYIRELVYTERTHVHKLKTMKYVYKVPMTRECVLPAEQVDQLFSSLEELIQFHGGLCTELVEHTANTTNGVVKAIADVLLPRFDGDAGKMLCQSCSLSATNQVIADTLIKDWRRKNEKFKTFIKSAELHPVCRRHRLTLTELMPITWQRLTKYQLLVKNILSSYKKHWEKISDNDKEEAQKIETTLTCIKGILQYVNKQLNLAQSRQRLLEYQSKLDTTSLERSSHPIAQQFKALDLTIERRRLLHEGPLTWKIQGRKVIELYALLLTDILVLLERHEERDKFYLRCYTVEGLGGVKEELSPVIRLKDCLLRSAAADKGGRTFLMVNNSSLMKLAQMYEFTTDSPREKRQWEEAISRAMQGQDILSPDPPVSPGSSDLQSAPLTAMHGSSQDVIREQLNRIDEEIKRLLNEKLRILRSMQRTTPTIRSRLETKGEEEGDVLGDPKTYVSVAIEQAGEMASTLSHVMVTNPTKNILAQTQSRLADIISEAQRNFSKLMLSLDPHSSSPPDEKEGAATEGTEGKVVQGDGNEHIEQEESGEDVKRESDVIHDQTGETPEGMATEGEDDDTSTSSGPLIVAHHVCTGPEGLPPADVVSLSSQEGVSVARGDKELSHIISPPETFSCGDSATPTPQLETESMASGTITPRNSPCGGTNTPISPVSPRPQSSKDTTPPPEVVKRQKQLSVSELSSETIDGVGEGTRAPVERVMTLTGGPSPRLMHIIASSYKTKDTSANGGSSTVVRPERTPRPKPGTHSTSTGEDPSSGELPATSQRRLASKS